MFRVEQVLVPLDFSSHSQAAFSFVRSLPSPVPGIEGPEIQLVHALRPMPDYMREILYPYAALGEDDRELEAEMLERLERRFFSFFGIDGKTEKQFQNHPDFKFGHPRELLPEWAGKYAADLVVLGAFGEGGSFVGGLGSTTRRFLERATTPVMVVRDFERVPKVKKILVATDLDRIAPEVIEKALGFALQLGAKLELLFVLPSPVGEDLHGLLRRQIKVKTGELLQKSQSTIDALFDRAVEQVDVPFSLKEECESLLKERQVLCGQPVKMILEAAHKSDADLIVVGSTRRLKGAKRALGQVAEAILADGSSHVLVVPPLRTKSLLVEE